MEKLFVSQVVEHELGWGSKSDGFAISKSLKALNKYIHKMVANQNYEYHWSYEQPVELYTTSKKVDMLRGVKVLEFDKLPKGDWFKKID